MMDPWYEGLKELGRPCFRMRRLKGDGIKSYVRE